MSTPAKPKQSAAVKKKPAAVKKKLAGRKAPAAKRGKPAAAKNPDGWLLRLYVAGQTPKSLTAFANLKRFCEEHLKSQYEIEIVDLMQHPQLAAKDQIVALPTLVRRLPSPVKRIVGDLTNAERVLVGMDFITLK